MDGFLIQFLAQAWRLIAIIIGLILLAIFVAWRNSKKKQDEIRQRKEALNPERAQKNAGKYRQKPSNTSVPNMSEEQAEFTDELFADDNLDDFEPIAMASEGSIFDDEDFFPVEDDSDQFEASEESIFSQASVEATLVGYHGTSKITRSEKSVSKRESHLIKKE